MSTPNSAGLPDSVLYRGGPEGLKGKRRVNRLYSGHNSFSKAPEQPVCNFPANVS